jgi:hypothetical protein
MLNLKINNFLHQCCITKLFYLDLDPTYHVFEDPYPTFEAILKEEKKLDPDSGPDPLQIQQGYNFVSLLGVVLNFSHKVTSNGS